MTAKIFSLTEFISKIQPFNTLPQETLNQLETQLETIRYRLEEKLLLPNIIPTHVLIICRGQVRLLGYDVCREREFTLEKLKYKSLVGANSLIREVYRETAIASTDVDCLALPREIFASLLRQHHNFAAYFRSQVSLIEIVEVLKTELNLQADGKTNLKQLAIQARERAVVRYFPPDKPAELDFNYQWYVSGGQFPHEIELNSYFDPHPQQLNLSRHSSSIRLLGIPREIFATSPSSSLIPTIHPTTEFNLASQTITAPEFLPTI